jgi:hypothetical protein
VHCEPVQVGAHFSQVAKALHVPLLPAASEDVDNVLLFRLFVMSVVTKRDRPTRRVPAIAANRVFIGISKT